MPEETQVGSGEPTKADKIGSFSRISSAAPELEGPGRNIAKSLRGFQHSCARHLIWAAIRLVGPCASRAPSDCWLTPEVGWPASRHPG